MNKDLEKASWNGKSTTVKSWIGDHSNLPFKIMISDIYTNLKIPTCAILLLNVIYSIYFFNVTRGLKYRQFKYCFHFLLANKSSHSKFGFISNKIP